MDKEKKNPTPLAILTSTEKITPTKSDIDAGMKLGFDVFKKVMDKQEGKPFSLSSLLRDAMKEIFNADKPINIDSHQNKALTDGQHTDTTDNNG